jgi:GntR family transcriptional regulator, rspAB operon transcriptional repressor
VSDTPQATSLADRAYLAIRDEILRGQLRPGTPLSRRRLALELGMSVLPVTDALRRLEDDGLVERRARAGTRVRVPSDTDIRELYELREALETQSARLFAERATPAQRLELRRLAAHVDVLFSRLPEGGDDPEFRFAVHSQHVQLHMCIAEHARSRLLKQMIERNHVLILNWLFDVTARRTPLPPSFHSQLAEALVSGDVDRADAAMRAHVRYGLTEIMGTYRALAASEWRERRKTPPATRTDARRQRPADARHARAASSPDQRGQ